MGVSLGLRVTPVTVETAAVRVAVESETLTLEVRCAVTPELLDAFRCEDREVLIVSLVRETDEKAQMQMTTEPASRETSGA